jgi:hypothetical protein
MNEPLTTAQVRSLLNGILAAGARITFAPHVDDSMAKRQVSLQEILAVLRGGAVRPGEFENGSWRYQVRGGRLTVVVTFRSETWVICVTTWRNR